MKKMKSKGKGLRKNRDIGRFTKRVLNGPSD